MISQQHQDGMLNPAAPTRHRAAVRCWVLGSLMLLGVLVPSVRLSAAETTNAFRPADTSSPRATLETFIHSCNELYTKIKAERYVDRTSPEFHPLVVRIFDCLDTSQVPQFERQVYLGEAAVCLKEILDRVELPPWDEIPDADAIKEAGGPEMLSRWQIPGTRLTIERVESGPQRQEYLFSPGTVQLARQYYRDVEGIPYRTSGPAVSPGFFEWFVSSPATPLVAKIVDWLPDWFRGRSWNLARWQWMGLIIAIVVALMLIALAYKMHARLAWHARDTSLLRYCLTLLFPVLVILIPLGFKTLVVQYLTVRGNLAYGLSFVANVISLLALVFVIFGLSNRIVAVILASPHINPKGIDAQLIRIIAKLLSVVAAVIIFLEGGHYLGFPLTTLIASAGVGGLAVALAAQDTLKNLFGTIMLLADKPFHVGERVVVGNYDGMVEEIGLRSTRIRLLTGHQVTIPNDELARNDVENVGRRPYIRRKADIHLPLQTSREKLEQALAVVREAVADHEGMDPDRPPRVFFLDFHPDAFVIRVFYWYRPPEYWDFLALGERINLTIFRAFEEQGIPFSLPARVSHTSLDGADEPLDVNLVSPKPAT